MKKTPVYFMPGLAADSKVFENLTLDTEKYTIYYLNWILPRTIDEDIAAYALRLSEEIKEKDPVLIGVSFGGIIVQELANYVHTKKVIIVSSAPQIRYPDCYGIDMAKMGDFIAFNAAVQLLKDTKQEHILTTVYDKCKAQAHLSKEEMVNYIQEIYKPFTAEQISVKISELLTPKGTRAKVKIIYQSISDLHASCPDHKGDWYFTGNYPTPGGVKVVNKAFMNYNEGNNARAY